MVEPVLLLVLVCLRAAIMVAEYAIDNRTRRALACERRLLLERAAGLRACIVVWERTRESSWAIWVVDSREAQMGGKE